MSALGTDEHPAIARARDGAALPMFERMQWAGPSRLQKLSGGDMVIFRAAMIVAGYIENDGRLHDRPDGSLCPYEGYVGGVCTKCGATENASAS